MTRSATIKSLHRSDWGLAAGIFAVALIVRLLFLFSHADADWPHSVYYEGDAPEWVRWAQALERGQPYEFDLPMRSPGVAYFLHVASKLTDLGGAATGHAMPLAGSFVGFKVVWCVLSALTCSVAYLGFVQVMARRVALVAAGLCTFYFGSYVTATSLNNEVPYAACVFGAVLVSLQMLRRPTWWLALVLAMLHGLAMLLRAEHPLLLLLMTGWLAWHWWMARSELGISVRTILVNTGMIVAGAVALCVPWSIRGAAAIHRFNTMTTESVDFNAVRLPNAPPDFPPVRWTPEAQAAINSLPAFARMPNVYQLTLMILRQQRNEVTLNDVHALFTNHFHYRPEPLKSWALLSIKGPLDFALANHPEAGGRFAKNAMLIPGEDNPVLHLAHPDHLYLVNHGYRQGWDYIKSDPSTWLQNVGRKLWSFSQGVTLGFGADDLPVGVYGTRRAVDLITPQSGSGVGVAWSLLVLGVFFWGIAIAATRRLGGLWLIIILAKVVVAVLFYGYARQAVSIYPAFAMFLAMPIDQILRRLDENARFTPRVRWTAALVIIAAIGLADVMAWRFPKGPSVSGPIVATPQWGIAAFECTDPLLIKPPAPSVTSSP